MSPKKAASLKLGVVSWLILVTLLDMVPVAVDAARTYLTADKPVVNTPDEES